MHTICYKNFETLSFTLDITNENLAISPKKICTDLKLQLLLLTALISSDKSYTYQFMLWY